ncbi:Mbeg1-like protein [Brotaphodocola sp.]|uniref:Mbeg1-like protein n=1 Tax=Brotaphodocola sp. TaxID=3073577 RepID=UPI003D7E5A21
MALTDNELILLDNLIYFDGTYTEGDSVEQIIEKIAERIQSDPEAEYASMSGSEWMDIISAVQENEKLKTYKVTNIVTPSDDIATGTAACFVDDIENPSDVNVIFKGSQNAYEWKDNGEGIYLIESDSQMAVAKYVNGLPSKYGNNITVSGHSKGGNKAQYVTIATDRVGRCVSEDGQGFSSEFCEKYAKQIEEKKNRIKNYCAESDFVNILGKNIAGETIFIKTDIQEKPWHYHKPNILLNEDGGFNDRGEQTEFIQDLQEYIQYMIDEVPEPQRSYVIDGLTGWMIAISYSESDNVSLNNRIIAGLTAAGYWGVWMLEKKEWFRDAQECLSKFIKGMTILVTPSSWFDMTRFSVDIDSLDVCVEHIKNYKTRLEDINEQLLETKRGLKGITYGSIRRSMDIQALSIQEEAKCCECIIKALLRVKSNYETTERRISGLFEM